MNNILPRYLKLVEKHALNSIRPISISRLLAKRFSPNLHREAALESLVRQSRWVHAELPIRLAHRLRDFHRMEFGVVGNPQIYRLYKIYLDSFEELINSPVPANEDDCVQFSSLLSNLRGKHADIIEDLPDACASVCHVFPNINLNKWLTDFLNGRIGNRVLTDNLVSHVKSLLNGKEVREGGVVHENVDLIEILENVRSNIKLISRNAYGLCPNIEIHSNSCVRVSLIPDHLSYILTEVLKNSVRATIDRFCRDLDGLERFEAQNPLPPIKIELFEGDFNVCINVRDNGGGIPPGLQESIWEFGASTNKCKNEMAGFGIGLPLSRLYAKYFGGDIIIQNTFGHGTSLYLTICSLGTSVESHNPSSVNF